MSIKTGGAMTRENIIRMAREAGFPFNKYGLLQGNEEGEIDADENLERFAALIAAVEREACAELCEQMDHDGVMIAADCAEAIRARGNT